MINSCKNAQWNLRTMAPHIRTSEYQHSSGANMSHSANTCDLSMDHMITHTVQECIRHEWFPHWPDGTRSDDSSAKRNVVCNSAIIVICVVQIRQYEMHEKDPCCSEVRRFGDCLVPKDAVILLLKPLKYSVWNTLIPHPERRPDEKHTWDEKWD